MANTRNIDLLVRAARLLVPFRDRSMYVGGVIVGLLVPEQEASSIRFTDDVDMVIEVATTAEYQNQVSDMLRRLGFEVDTRPGAPLCRWVHQDIRVDIMPIDGEVLGFENRWYRPAFKNTDKHMIAKGLEISVISAPYFIATKLETFAGRGRGDYLASADLEDIVTVIDGRSTIVEESQTLPVEVQRYFGAEFSRLLASRDFVDSLPAHLGYQQTTPVRLQRLEERLRRLSKLAT